MGFLKDVKDDLSMSVNEILGEDKEKKEKATTEQEDFLDADMYKDILAAAEEMLSEDEQPKQETNTTDLEEKEIKTNQEASNASDDKLQISAEKPLDHKDDGKSEDMKKTTPSELEKNNNEAAGDKGTKMHTTNFDLAKEDREAVTVITKGTTINGSIISDCSLDVMGTINGDIECLGKLSISGTVKGNSMASEVYVNTQRLEGGINSEGCVKVGLGTVVIGDITATSGVIAGAVKGELDIAGPLVVDSTAIIKGNIKAKSVQMNNGAILEGFCSLSYASVDINDIFE